MTARRSLVELLLASPRYARIQLDEHVDRVGCIPTAASVAAHVLDHDRTGEIVDELPADPLGRAGRSNSRTIMRSARPVS